MTTRERAPTVREADLEMMRGLLLSWKGSSYGWEDIWHVSANILPPSITKEDVRRFVIPRLAK